jgi:hypothetical protein
MPTAQIADLYVDPQGGVEHLAEQVEAYWELAIAPYWGRIARYSKAICSIAVGS